MGKSKSASIEIPTYQKPSASAYDIYGTKGLFDPSTNTYSISDVGELETIAQAKKIRTDLLNSLGLGGDISQDPYTQTYMNELLRLTQPRTEQALIGRGLGGSSVYKDALTDLLTKSANQAILSGQQYKMTDLSALSDYINTQQTLGQNLLNMVTSQYNTDQSRAWQQYMDMLPYLLKVNAGKSSSLGGIGSLVGGGLGALLALPTGGMSVPMGAALGSSIGGSVGSGGMNPVDLSWLTLMNQPSVLRTGTSNIANNPFALSTLGL